MRSLADFMLDPTLKWIGAIEIKPQARANVHHVIAYTQPAGQPINQAGVLGPGNIGGVTPNKPGVVFWTGDQILQWYRERGNRK